MRCGKAESWSTQSKNKNSTFPSRRLTAVGNDQVRSGMGARAALTFLLHSLGLFRATARACAGPIDHSFI